MDVYIVLFFFGGEGECRGFNAVCDGGDSGSGRCHGLPMHVRNCINGPLRECPRAGRFRATLLLRTTCMHSCCNWSASCVAAQQTKNQPKTSP